MAQDCYWLNHLTPSSIPEHPEEPKGKAVVSFALPWLFWAKGRIRPRGSGRSQEVLK